MGLKPFRNIPQDIVEWTKWCNAQDVGSSTTTTTTTTNTDGSTTTTTTTQSAWTIEDFTSHYTIQSADAGKIKRSMGGSATNVTLNGGALAEGEQVVILQYGAGTVTIVAGSGQTIRTPSTLVFNEQYGTVTIIALNSAEAFVAGRMAP